MGQANLVVNEFSQGPSGAVKEYIEFVVVGTRTCTDSTADLRNWIIDDHNGWYGGSGTGIATGHYRFKNTPEWSKIPYGSIILIYNAADRNPKIPVGSDDPTDANHDYVYILPINSTLIEQNIVEPVSPSSFTYTYPTTGYTASGDWSGIVLANGGDAVITVNPSNLSTASHSVVFGFTPATGGQVPHVVKAAVGSGACLYLSDENYNTADSWIIGAVGTADETPGTGNTPDNIAWLNAMRVQQAGFVVTTSTVQPTCTNPTGQITVTAPLGANYTYAIDGGAFQTSPTFLTLAPGNHSITVKENSGCESTIVVSISNVPNLPAVPEFTVQQPTCATPTGTITVLAPLGTGFTYSIDGTNFQAGVSFTAVVPGVYTLTVTNGDGCSNTSQVTVNAAPNQPAPPTVSTPVNYCLGQTATPLSATGTNLLWYSSASGGTGQSVAPTPLTTTAGSTSYFVSQTQNGCESNRAEIVVQVTEFNLNDIEGENVICLVGNTTTQLSNDYPSGIWSSSNPTVATISADGLVTALSAGTTTIQYSASSGVCADQVTMDITVSDFHIVLNGPANPVTQGNSVTVEVFSNDPFTVDAWMPVSLFPDQTLTSQTFIADTTQIISVAAISINGCIDTAYFNLVVITADDEIFIPNAFTPNNDGLNDVFMPYGNSIRMVETTIFNQWGEKIFSGKSLPGGWNGKHNGKVQPSGVYIYVMKITLQSGKVVTRKGSVNLLH